MKKRKINFWVVIIIIFSNLLISNTLLAQTQEEIYKELIRQEVKCPDIVMAQILYETGHLESNRFQVQHNHHRVSRMSNNKCYSLCIAFSVVVE